ncbi:MAG: hypothetical protein ACXW2Q_09705 [Thermoanaerobaculia bacterium]
MIDNTNPSSQFHPYMPVDATPQTEVPRSGLGDILRRAGIDDRMLDSVRGIDMRQSLEKVRSYARSNPSIVLGGLAALAIGAGLMRKRSIG